MKFWIIRLDGSFVASASYQSMVQSQDEIETNDGRDKSLQSDKVIDELKLNDSVKAIINHSRTQSLSLYENELIYCKMQGNSYYYRAKHNLLFIYVEQFKEKLQLKVSSIDNVILRAIKLYEGKCEKNSCTYKLPRIISKYQEKQLEMLDQPIKEIVYQQECLELEMPLLRRESSLRDDSVIREMAKLTKEMASIQEVGARRDQLKEIEQKEQRLKKQPLMFERYSAKNLSGHRLKLYCLGVLLFFIVISSGFLYSYHNSRNEILI